MARWGLVIDLDRCTGCQACVVACKHENNVPFSTPEQARAGRLMSWIQLVPGEIAGQREAAPMPMMCQHCDRPPCTDVCPTSATYLNPEGIVAQVYPRCIGCRYCANACPYAAKVFNWTAPEWPESMAAMKNPDVSVRPRGVIEKCTFCHHRLQQARERARAAGTRTGRQRLHAGVRADVPARGDGLRRSRRSPQRGLGARDRPAHVPVDGRGAGHPAQGRLPARQ